jgi:hypothetical protein
LHQGFRIHFGHSPHVNNDIGGWIDRVAGRVCEVAVEMPHVRRQFGLVLASVKDNDLMSQGVKPSDRVGSSKRRASKNQDAHGECLLVHFMLVD